MTMTMTQAIARVRRYLDDDFSGTNARWSDQNIIDSINGAGSQIMTEAAGLGLDIFKLTTNFVPVNNTLTLTPGFTKICDVSVIAGNSRLRVMPGTPKGTVFVSNGMDGRTMEITYIPVYAAPALVGDNIVYGTGLTFNNNIVDTYLCLLAARDCKVIEGDANMQLENQLNNLKQAFRSIANNPSTSVMHAYGKIYRTGYSWYALSETTIRVAI